MGDAEVLQHLDQLDIDKDSRGKTRRNVFRPPQGRLDDIASESGTESSATESSFKSKKLARERPLASKGGNVPEVEQGGPSSTKNQGTGSTSTKSGRK